MRTEKGFINGCILPIFTRVFVFVVIAFMLYNSSFSVSFVGHEAVKTLIEVAIDKVGTLVPIVKTIGGIL